MQNGEIKMTHSSDTIDLFTDTAAILNSIVSNTYYGMLRGQISMYLPPEHPIIDIWNNGIQNGRRIGKKVYWARPNKMAGQKWDEDWNFLPKF